jgi:lysophospholipase
MGESYAPSTSGAAYCLEADFEGNTLTTDREMWDFMVDQLHAEPALCLGGPSMQWLHLALRECAALAQAPAPNIPALTYVGADEAIVDNDAIFAQMTNWPNGETIVVPNAQHEVLMHATETRNQIMADICSFFGRHTEVPKTPTLKRA